MPRVKGAVAEAHEPVEALHLSSAVQRALEATGLVRLTAIQADAIRLGRWGADVLVQGPCRSGKTAAAVVLAIEGLHARGAHAEPELQALFVAPSRELALQTTALVADVLALAHPRLRCSSLVGGTEYAECARACARADVACGTPGRLAALLDRGHLCARNVRFVALDEYDLLLDGHSFGEALSSVLGALPARRQTVALAAAAPPELAARALAHMRAPVALVGGERAAAAAAAAKLGGLATTAPIGRAYGSGDGAGTPPVTAGVRHRYVLADGASEVPGARAASASHTRAAAVLGLLESLPFRQAVVFARSPEVARALGGAIGARGWLVVTLSAADEPAAREAALAQMCAARVRVLVATDLVARGVECGGVDLVLHADLPQCAASYANRAGRAAAAGAQGLSVAVVLAAELPTLLRLAGQGVELVPMPLSAASQCEPRREAVVYDYDDF
jgi:superfamily II DNA/RNA helicase